MSTEPVLPGLNAPPAPPPPETYPFWGYLDLVAFFLIAMLGVLVESLLAGLLAGLFVDMRHVQKIFVLFPAQCLLYLFLLGTLAVIFRRYYGRPFWQSLRWSPPGLSTSAVVSSGVAMAFGVMLVSLLMRTPDIDTPLKALLSDPVSVALVAALGTTIGPLCEEVVFRGFLQPLLVRSFGVGPGILLAAAPFGLLHLPEYGYSWRHALLITAAGAAFGWMRQRTGSTKAAAIMHASYNGVFFLLLVVQEAAMHGHWTGYGR